MDKKDILFLRNMLLVRRNDILDRVNLFVSAWKNIEHAIEVEEEAQKASIAEPYDRLDETRKNEVRQIDLALSKMAVGDYGICESCGDDISKRRLEALPWARLCVDCAKEFERRHESLPRTSEILTTAQLPDRYRELSAERIVRLIEDQFHKNRQIDMTGIRTSLRRGFVYLEGTVSTELEHQAVLQLLTGTLGFFSVVDRLEVEELSSDKTENRQGPDEAEEDQDELQADQEELTEDLFDTHKEEGFYSTSDGPAHYEDNM